VFTNDEQGKSWEKIVLHQYNEISCYFRQSMCQSRGLSFYPFIYRAVHLFHPSPRLVDWQSMHSFNVFPLLSPIHPPLKPSIPLIDLSFTYSYKGPSFNLSIILIDYWSLHLFGDLSIHPSTHTNKHTHTHIHSPILWCLHHSHRKPSSTIRPSCHPRMTK